MLWINFLHLYQPANTDGRLIIEAAENSYIRLVDALEKNKKIKFTFNISGCLLLRLDELGYGDLIERISKLVKAGQLEITGTAAYHPFLPLIPLKEAEKQISENEEILKKYLGLHQKPKGFFLPEMAYHPEIAKLVKKMGYEWLILDEIAYGGKMDMVDFEKIYIDKNSALRLVFRSRKFSKTYVPYIIRDLLIEKKESLAITATDAELIGLRHNDPEKEFEKLFSNPDLMTQTVSEFIGKKNSTETIKLKSHTWETTIREYKEEKPYQLWQDKNNLIQNKLWEIAEYTIKILEQNKKDPSYDWARWHLVRGLASCTFWWASARDFRLFAPPSWSPDEIEKGLNEFIRAIRTLDGMHTRPEKIEIEKKGLEIKRMIWLKHWKKYWKPIK